VATSKNRRKCAANLLEYLDVSIDETKFDLSRGWYKLFGMAVHSLRCLGWDGRIDRVSSDLGLLRIDIPNDSARDPAVWELLAVYERAALHICEECGDENAERYIFRDHSFINLCPYCKDHSDVRPLPRLACAFPPGDAPR
jgi:hypothetical protein